MGREQRGDVVARRLADGDDSEGARHDGIILIRTAGVPARDPEKT
jgi:hypothetical protein